MKRKTFLKQGVLGAGALVTLPLMRTSSKYNDIFSPEAIYEFVAAAHKDFDETKRIVEANPLILNCTNQFSMGDFETAVGGASHMGRRDIANLLIAKGARLDIFNFAFIGFDDLVKQLVDEYPQLLRAPGPHGFTLLHHAKVGERKNLMSWLQEKGLTETHFKGVFGSSKSKK